MISCNLYHTSKDNIGREIYGLTGGVMSHQEFRAKESLFAIDEYITYNPEKRYPLEYIDAVVHNFFLKKGFSLLKVSFEDDPQRLIQTSSRKYTHANTPSSEYDILTSLPKSRNDISITIISKLS